MKLSISNIGWKEQNDANMYEQLHSAGFSGLEIAPTRIFPEHPYNKVREAMGWADELRKRYSLQITSLQSIWYGQQGKVFGSDMERDILKEYTERAIDFAEAVGAHNLVFGCPRNRVAPDEITIGLKSKVVHFFYDLGEYAASHNTVLSIEANPPIYHTNFINRTEQAFDFVREVNSVGFKVNLDVGTMIANDEGIEVLNRNVALINHVHISEPRLDQVQHHELHIQLAEKLKDYGYTGYVSIEMGSQDDLQLVRNVMFYVKEVFG